MKLGTMFFAAAVLVLMIMLPLFFIHRRVKTGKKGKGPLVTHLCSFFGILLAGAVFCIGGAASAESAAAVVEASDGMARGLGYIGAALAVGLSGIGGGIAVSAAASAALGAISENEKTFGKALIFVGLAEGVALYGLLIAFMIISSL